MAAGSAPTGQSGGLFSNFAGTQYGHFFKIVPPHVKKSLPPGVSPIPIATFQSWLLGMPFVLWSTPNTVWAVLALIFYFAFPYDLSRGGTAAAAPLSWAFFQERAPLWFVLTFGYSAFWHVSIYFLDWAERPFIKARKYSVDKVAHNLFWSFSGIAIWVAFENVFAFLWATGRLAYESDAAAFSSPAGIARFIAALMLIPVFRDFHFFFAHRLLHFKSLYQQVHSLHHRNTDIEPFAGLCMHPVEHLYYYACILPSLVFYASPFAFLWNGVHLLLAPAASHSGYEDHFQADAFHYMHHRYFEVNYAGANASFLDQIFGTFCEKFRKEDQEGAKPRDDAKSTLIGAPTVEFTAYLSLSGLCLLLWAVQAVAFARGGPAVSDTNATGLALLAGFGPVVLAYIVSALFKGSGGPGGSGKQGLVSTVIQLVVGALFCSVPVSAACYLALQPARY